MYSPSVCVAPLTQNVTGITCDLNSSGAAATSGSVTRRQTKSAYPTCTFGTPVTVDNSTYVSDNCVYPPPALAVSCSGTPGDAYVGQTVTWSSSVTGGSSSAIYEWSGTDKLSLSDTVPTIKKTYTTPGIKEASLTVTDPASRKTATAACGTGVTVKSCTASLTAESPIEQGLNTKLSWSVPGGAFCASSCSGAVDGVIGFETGGKTVGTNVPASILPTPPATTYTLTCSGGTYGPPPAVNITVKVITPDVVITVNDQTSVARVDSTKSGKVTISWTPAQGNTSVTSCEVSKNTDPLWVKPVVGSSGTVTDENVTTQTVYTVKCENKQGVQVKKTVMVNAPVGYQEF